MDQPDVKYVARLKAKLAGLKGQHEQLFANLHAVSGAIQVLEEELLDQAKDTEHGNSEQAATE